MRNTFIRISLMACFVFGLAISLPAHIVDADPNESPKLRNPVDIVISPDGSLAVVVCHNNSIAVIDLNSGKYEVRNISPSQWPGQHPVKAYFIGNTCFVVNEYSEFITEFDPGTLAIIANHKVPLYCQDMLYDASAEIIYVTNRWLDEVLLYDRAFNSLGSGIKVGRNPKAMAFGQKNKLYVGNVASWDVSVVDLGSRQVVETHYLGSGPTGLAAVGDNIAVTNHGGRNLNRINGAPMIENDQADIINVVTFIDQQNGSMQDMFKDQGGDYMDLVVDKGLIVFTAGATGSVHIAETINPGNTLQTLDLLADEWGLPGGRAPSRLRIFSHTVGAAVKDNRTVYSINYFRDTVVEIKYSSGKKRYVVNREIPLNAAGVAITAFQRHAGAVNMNTRQSGERYFKTIAGWFRGQWDFTCATCHVDGHSDFRFIFDKNPDPFNSGSVQGPEKHPSAISTNLTAPFAWEGTKKSLLDFNKAALNAHDVPDGTDNIHNDVASFMVSFEELLRPEPNPFPKPNRDTRNPNAPERGKAVFVQAACLSCHNNAAFTNQAMHDVGTGRMLDTPSLIQLWDKAPYLHDGRAKTLYDVLDPSLYSTPGAHGAIAQLSESQKTDLVAYLNAIDGNDIPTAVVDEPVELPATFQLKQNYPNPFNPETVIAFSVPENANVELSIYNMLGQRIRTLIHENRNAGDYQIKWDGRNGAGRQVPAGIYVYQLHVGTYLETRKMVIIK
ncbi:MAG: FlgD immunoglobulin-like domain containing protein [bacterium]